MLVSGIERNYIIHDENQIKGFFGDYRFLSNFHPGQVFFEGELYPSTENAYQAAKCLNRDERTKFLTCTPSESKKLGRAVSMIENWQSIKYDVMSAVVFDKFYRNQDLRAKLLLTKQAYLEETNHWNDVYWGVCNGKGENSYGCQSYLE